MSPGYKQTPSMKTPLKTVDLLTNSELDNAIKNLFTFYHYTTFEERDVDATTGMLYALEFIACNFGLVRLDLPGPDGDALMSELVSALHKRAMATDIPAWYDILPSLPYSRGLV